jgi:hypothetical protein
LSRQNKVGRKSRWEENLFLLDTQQIGAEKLKMVVLALGILVPFELGDSSLNPYLDTWSHHYLINFLMSVLGTFNTPFFITGRHRSSTPNNWRILILHKPMCTFSKLNPA